MSHKHVRIDRALAHLTFADPKSAEVDVAIRDVLSVLAETSLTAESHSETTPSKQRQDSGGLR
jgi:hypothetical protein